MIDKKDIEMFGELLNWMHGRILPGVDDMDCSMTNDGITYYAKLYEGGIAFAKEETDEDTTESATEGICTANSGGDEAGTD